MDEPKTEMSQDVQRVLEIYSLTERLIDKDLDRAESRLNDRINKLKEDSERDLDEVKKDLHDRICRLDSRLRWRMTFIFAGVSILVATLTIVVPLIFQHFSSKLP
jgi:hypothetical protein